MNTAEPPRRPRSPLRLLLFAAVGLLLAMIAASDVLHGFVLGLVAQFEPFAARHPVAGAVAFVFIAALSAMLVFLSSAVLVPVAVVAWGHLACFLLLWVGWTLGGAFAYGLARGLGRRLIVRLIPVGTLERYEDRISRRTPLPVVLLFQLALPSEVPGYVLGLVRFGLWRYLAILALAELPYAVGTVYLGASFLERRTVAILLLVVAGLGVGTWALHALEKRLDRDPEHRGPRARSSGHLGSR